MVQAAFYSKYNNSRDVLTEYLTLKYLGSKKKLIPFLEKTIKSVVGNDLAKLGTTPNKRLERILNCCGLFEGKSPHPNPLPEGEGTLFGSPDQFQIRSRAYFIMKPGHCWNSGTQATPE